MGRAGQALGVLFGLLISPIFIERLLFDLSSQTLFDGGLFEPCFAFFLYHYFGKSLFYDYWKVP
jgi:hypothetical protein